MQKQLSQRPKSNRLKVLSSLIALFLISGLVSSCEYENKEEYFVEVEDAEQPSLVVELSVDDDIIEVYDNKMITYTVSSQTSDIYGVAVIIDEEREIYTSEETQGSFQLNNHNCKTGSHNLKFQVILKTNSGSLADNLEAEAFIFEKEYEVISDFSELESIEIQDIKIEDGRLKITFDQYEGIGFDSYVLRRNTVDFAEGADKICESKIQGANSIIDSTYTGGDYKYFIQLKAREDNAYSNSRSVNYPIPQIKADYIGGSNVKLTWSKTPFYNNFGSYYIMNSEDGSQYFSHILLEIDDVDKTSYVIDENYPDKINTYYLYVKPNKTVNGLWEHSDAPYSMDTCYVGS